MNSTSGNHKFINSLQFMAGTVDFNGRILCIQKKSKPFLWFVTCQSKWKEWYSLELMFTKQFRCVQNGINNSEW